MPPTFSVRVVGKGLAEGVSVRVAMIGLTGAGFVGIARLLVRVVEKAVKSES